MHYVHYWVENDNSHNPVSIFWKIIIFNLDYNNNEL